MAGIVAAVAAGRDHSVVSSVSGVRVRVRVRVTFRVRAHTVTQLTRVVSTGDHHTTVGSRLRVRLKLGYGLGLRLGVWLGSGLRLGLGLG